VEVGISPAMGSDTVDSKHITKKRKSDARMHRLPTTTSAFVESYNSSRKTESLKTLKKGGS